MSIKKLLIIFSILFIASPIYAIDEDELFSRKIKITQGSELSVADCVALAFKNSPKIKRQKYNLDIAKSNVGIARSAYFPIFSAGVGFYNENNSNSVYYNKTYRNLPSVSIALNKLIWDFGKTTALIKMDDFHKIAAEYEFMDSICATLFDTKAKYYKVLKFKAKLAIAQKDVEMGKRFLKISRGLPDKETAEVAISNSIGDVINFEKDYKNALLDLNNSMYLDTNVDFKVKNTKTFYLKPNFTENLTRSDFNPEKFKFSRDNAVQIAYENSPDLQVLVNTKKAMEQSLIYVKRMYFPELKANVGYGFNNNNISDTNNSLQVGVNLSSTVNLMELRHSLKKGDAQVNRADNEITLFKKDLYYEVKRALNNVDKAERITIETFDTIKDATDELKLVEAEYKSGKLDYMALQNARKDYINALYDYVNYVYEYNMALIQVEMAMHYHIADIHHKTEHAMHNHADELIEHLNEALECDEQEVNNRKHKSKREKL